jgi:hypothetical protein
VEQLASQWGIQIPAGPHVFGKDVNVELVLPNPFGREFFLLEPVDGYIIEFSWRVERWMPFGSSEVVHRKHVANFDRLLEFTAGQTIRYPIIVPLGGLGERAAVWRIQLSAKLRCDGLEIDDETFPVGSIDLKGNQIIALPGNWESLNDNPLQNLERLISITDPKVDRHLLVCSALLSSGERSTAVNILVGNLDKAPSVRRMDTMMASLRFLTGRDFGENALLWKKWWKEHKIDNREQPRPARSTGSP